MWFDVALSLALFQPKADLSANTSEVATEKHNIHLEHSSNSSSGMALPACGCQASRSGYALNVSSSSHSHECLIDSGASYHMAKNKAMFSYLNDCNTKNIY